MEQNYSVKTKRIILIVLSVFFSINICMGYDHIIFRNGKESDVKLHQINDEKIIYGYIGDATGAQQEILLKDVYMIYIEKQGNIYITADGKRITGESKRVNPKRNDVIYLVKGTEIAANNVRITESDIHYSVKPKEVLGLLRKGDAGEAAIKKSEVFMIRYKSGMVDIITPIDGAEESPKDSVVTEVPKPQYAVIFHAVVRGDNLENIAEKYNVSIEKIIEWNELPARTKPTSPLTIGMQLMIYQPK